MKHLPLVLLVFLISQTGWAQKKSLTLQDAVIGRYTNLKPNTFDQYGWIRGSDEFWWIETQNEVSTLFQQRAGDDESKRTIYTLQEFNQIFEDSLNFKRFPKLEWFSEESFYFMQRKTNQVFVVNPLRGTTNKVLDLPKDAENIHIQPPIFKATFNRGRQLFVQSGNGQPVLVGSSNPIEQDIEEYRQNAIEEGKKKGRSKEEIYEDIERYIYEKEKEAQQNSTINHDITYGKAVHRYEFGIEKGVFWHSGGNRFAFYRNDQSEVQDYPLANYDSVPAELQSIKYPMAGSTNEKVDVGVYDIENVNTVYLERHWSAREYITNLSWDPTGKYIYAIELNRNQNQLQLNKYDAASGNYEGTVVQESHSKYVHPDQSIVFLNDNRYIYLHERNGLKQMDVYDRKDRFQFTVYTRKVKVSKVLGHFENTVYFEGIDVDGIEQHIYSVTLDEREAKNVKTGGSGISTSKTSNYLSFPLIQLTKESGYHSGSISSTGRFILDRFSTANNPYQLDLINLETRSINTLHKPNNPLEEYQLGSTELIDLKADDGTKLFARMIKPYDFDRSKSYPALVYVYNGPNVQLIKNTYLYGAPLWMHYLANKGYIIFTVDGRGSYNRGCDFEQATFRQLGQLEMADQLKGVEYLAKQNYIETSRLAVHGWSYGGFMTLSLMTNHPDVFKVGIAGGPVTDWSMYEIMYTERYMDTPETNKSGYEKTSVLSKADQLKGDLLIIHGTDDDVVLPQHSMRFLKASVKSGKQVDFFMYPGHKHNVRGMDRIHLIDKIIRYVEANL